MNVFDNEKKKEINDDLSDEDDESELTYQSVRNPIEEDEQMIEEEEQESSIIELKVKQTSMPFNRHRFKEILRSTTWSNPFIQGRSKHENTDVYKIFGILYGLVIFIGGVVFSISHAIISHNESKNIKHLVSIYFIYLYWISIIWIVFCIFDIIRHKRILNIHSTKIKTIFDKHSDMTYSSIQSPFTEHDQIDNQLEDNSNIIHQPIRRQIFNPNGEHTLRTYVSNRKTSIVQRVIGYNYDDHSTAGGLYIRVGIGIFCLGTVIHCGLSILSNLENVAFFQWTELMDDFSRLLFSFIQFFFIFKHSNLIIHAHESIARLAVMHIVVTNLCVWFRMVVIETKSQIFEMNEHSMNNNQSMIISINEGHMKLKPFLYPCTIEFSLMCLTLFFLIWENIGKTFAYKTSNKASTKNVFMVNCHASIKGLFIGMIIFSCTLISIILYGVLRNKIVDDIISPTSLLKATVSYRNHSSIMISTTLISNTWKKPLYSIAIVEIVNLCLLIISLFATLWALFKIRKLQYRKMKTRFDNVLIIVSLTGIYLYSIFSAFALLNNTQSATWIVYVKIVIVILEFIEGTVHAFFILIALHKRLHRSSKQEYPAREVITLLIIIDLSLWFEETTTTTKNEANPFQLAFYHVIPWSIIAAIATPLQIFFRFHASVCLSHVWENMYTLSVDEPVAPHGL